MRFFDFATSYRTFSGASTSAFGVAASAQIALQRAHLALEVAEERPRGDHGGALRAERDEKGRPGLVSGIRD